MILNESMIIRALLALSLFYSCFDVGATKKEDGNTLFNWRDHYTYVFTGRTGLSPETTIRRLESMVRAEADSRFHKQLRTIGQVRLMVSRKSKLFHYAEGNAKFAYISYLRKGNTHASNMLRLISFHKHGCDPYYMSSLDRIRYSQIPTAPITTFFIQYYMLLVYDCVKRYETRATMIRHMLSRSDIKRIDAIYSSILSFIMDFFLKTKLNATEIVLDHVSTSLCRYLLRLENPGLNQSEYDDNFDDFYHDEILDPCKKLCELLGTYTVYRMGMLSYLDQQEHSRGIEARYSNKKWLKIEFCCTIISMPNSFTRMIRSKLFRRNWIDLNE